MRARTPIEMMVDKACGFDPAKTSEPPVILRCPKCGCSKTTVRSDADPIGTREVIAMCPKCVETGPYLTTCLDKDGKEINQ